MTTVALIGDDPAARGRVRHALEAAGIVVTSESDSIDGIAHEADVIAVSTHGGDEEPMGRAEPLTSREQEVLALLADGYSNRRAAERLGISEHTVKFHVASIYGKLGATSRAAVIRRAARRGLIAL